MVRRAGLGEQYIDLGMLSFQESCSDIRAEVGGSWTYESGAQMHTYKAQCVDCKRAAASVRDTKPANPKCTTPTAPDATHTLAPHAPRAACSRRPPLPRVRRVSSTRGLCTCSGDNTQLPCNHKARRGTSKVQSHKNPNHLHTGFQSQTVLSRNGLEIPCNPAPAFRRIVSLLSFWDEENGTVRGKALKSALLSPSCTWSSVSLDSLRVPCPPLPPPLTHHHTQGTGHHLPSPQGTH